MTTRERLSVRQIIQELAPRTWRTTSNPKSKYTMKCPLCEYEHRDGRQPNHFTVDETDFLFRCHVCHAQGNAFQLRRFLTQGHEFQSPDLPPDSPRRSTASGQRIPWEGATINTLAQDKGLDAVWLHQVLGWRNTTYRGSKTPVIEIPYPDENNADPLTRYRVGVSGDGERYIWQRFERGQRARPYGLAFLSGAREYGYIILEEGETDFATLLHEDLPALGTPGNSWSKEWNHYLEGLKVYVWQEPDRGGEGFVESVTKALPEVWVIKPPPGIKDPNEMFRLAGPERFRDWMLELLDEATTHRQEPPAAAPPFDEEHWDYLMDCEGWEDDEPDEPEDYSQVPIGSCFIPQKQLRFRSWSQGNIEYGEMKKLQFIDSLPELTDGQREKKRRIRLCWDNFKKFRCRNTGETYLQRLRCGESVCPNCSVWLADAFFTATNDEGRSRMDILREHCLEPTIYMIYVGSLRLSDDPVEAGNQLARQHKALGKMDTHLTANLSEELDFAANHIRGIRTRMEGDVAHYQMVMPGNHEHNARAKLEAHFRKETGLDIQVTEVICSSIEDLKDKMVQLMALRCDWDTAYNYSLWRAATKGSRMLQGKGVFHKVSGTRAPKQLRLKLAECKVCGSCEPVELGGTYPVATTRTRKVTSEWTGKTYLVDLEDQEQLAMAAD